MNDDNNVLPFPPRRPLVFDIDDALARVGASMMPGQIYNLMADAMDEAKEQAVPNSAEDHARWFAQAMLVACLAAGSLLQTDRRLMLESLK